MWNIGSLEIDAAERTMVIESEVFFWPVEKCASTRHWS